MDPIKDFGTVTNLVLSVSVTAYGLGFWLRDRNLGKEHRYRLVAYRCWWASWLCWVLAWTMLLIAAVFGPKSVQTVLPKDVSVELNKNVQIMLRENPPSGISQNDHIVLRENVPLELPREVPIVVSREIPLGLKVITLFFDNLNSIFMILVYFVLTRGNDFDTLKIKVAFKQICGTLALGCAILYLLSPVISMNFAYEVHRTWSLCLGVFAPMLIGWACSLRYNTLMVLVVGFAYGFMQPLIYATELATVQNNVIQSINELKPVIAMTLGGLKVLWAVVFMQVLAHGVPSDESLIASKTGIRFKFFRHWEKKVLGHALVLGVAYCCLLVAMVTIYAKGLSALTTALGLVGGFMGLLDWFWKFWKIGEAKTRTAHTK